MDFQAYIESEAKQGRFVGEQLIKRSALYFAKYERITLPVATVLAREVYDANEGFDGEPTSLEYFVRLMYRTREATR